MTEKTLSGKFTEERRKINTEIKDERATAHAHTTINKIEKDAKLFIKKLNDFIDEEKRTVGEDERHTERFCAGFKSACIIIRDELNRGAGSNLK